MLDKLVLIGLGFMFGYTLDGVLTDLAMNIKPASLDVSALIASVVLLAITLGVQWREHRS